MVLLIIDPFSEDYRRGLQPKFPQISIHAVTNQREVGDVIKKTQILAAHGTRISDGLIKKASKLQWIQCLGTGVDAILNCPSLKNDVLVTSTRGIHGPQMSELAFLLMLALNRNFPQIVRNQDGRMWERWPAKLLYQKKVGILGVGVVGEEIARKCKAFGMTVFGIDIVRREIDAIDYFCGPEELLRVIPEVDYFIIVPPLTPQTQRMIGAKVLSSMKSTSFLINIARGGIVDEEALIDALKAGKIAGAALDVFWKEPLTRDHPFWGMKNVIITPHVGGLSDIYVKQVMPIIEENLRRFLRGERQRLINIVER